MILYIAVYTVWRQTPLTADKLEAPQSSALNRVHAIGEPNCDARTRSHSSMPKVMMQDNGCEHVTVYCFSRPQVYTEHGHAYTTERSSSSSDHNYHLHNTHRLSLDCAVLLCQDELNVAGAGHVGCRARSTGLSNQQRT